MKANFSTSRLAGDDMAIPAQLASFSGAALAKSDRLAPHPWRLSRERGGVKGGTGTD